MMPYTVEFLELKPLSQLIIVHIINKGYITKDSIINKLNEKNSKLENIVDYSKIDIYKINDIDNAYNCINDAIDKSLTFLENIKSHKYTNSNFDKSDISIYHANLILNKYIKDGNPIKEAMDKIIYNGWTLKYSGFKLYNYNVPSYFINMYSAIKQIKLNNKILESDPLQLIKPLPVAPPKPVAPSEIQYDKIFNKDELPANIRNYIDIDEFNKLDSDYKKEFIKVFMNNNENLKSIVSGFLNKYENLRKQLHLSLLGMSHGTNMEDQYDEIITFLTNIMKKLNDEIKKNK